MNQLLLQHGDSHKHSIELKKPKTKENILFKNRQNQASVIEARRAATSWGEGMLMSKRSMRTTWGSGNVLFFHLSVSHRNVHFVEMR